MSPAQFQLPDRYRVTGHVASGGMAAVYAAHDEILNRKVAVKVLAEHLNEDESAKVRFQREARAAAGLSSHPHVVTIYDVGECDGRSFIVMELLDGGSLAAVLRSGRRIERGVAVRWLRDAASALDAAHAAGIVHRDIKPANLLLDNRGGLAIADFGIARIAESDGVTMTGQVLGTAAYLSPEQALGEPATAASDRYALAVVAFELLTGRRPFEGEHFAAQARAHIEDEPPKCSEFAADLPPGVDAVLDRGLAKAPEDRWPSAAAFVEALEAALQPPAPPPAPEPDPEPTRQMTATAVAPKSPPPRRPREPVAAAAPPPPGPGRRSSAPWAVIGAVLLALLAGGVAIAAFGGGDGGGTATTDTPTTESKAEKPKKERTPTPTPTATETATPEATATPEPTPTATPEENTEAVSGEPSTLNNQGYAKYQAGDYNGAIPLLQGAVDGCGNSTELDPCGYALFNLGSALHRAGRSSEAIPYLERRLANFDYKEGEVQAELDAARAAAGQGGEVEDDDGGKGRGRGRGKDKD